MTKYVSMRGLGTFAAGAALLTCVLACGCNRREAAPSQVAQGAPGDVNPAPAPEAEAREARAPEYGPQYSPPAPDVPYAEAPAGAAAKSAPAPYRSESSAGDSARGDAYRRESPSKPKADDEYYGGTRRPGLATRWGEERNSPTVETWFQRGRTEPFAQVAIRYDDARGVESITGMDEHYAYPGVFALAGGALTVSLTESDGDPWPALTAGGRNFVIGDAGDRYDIHVVNHSPGRFEVVASVDGLDVIDGQDAQLGKRGYVIAPWGSLDIDGFRSAQDAVHAFRFGDVDESYAVARGRGADVGVVGVAVFEERGYHTDSRPWDNYHEPNTFPGRFAPPPGY